MTRWSQVGGNGSADGYQARFDRLAARGHDVHGEAGLCSRLVPAGARVLDAGCGTGRVAIELARRGYDVVGVDVDERMLTHAQAAEGGVTWLLGDLATLDLPSRGVREPFDLALCAGNVIPLVAAGTEQQVLRTLVSTVRPGGLVVTGFGLDAAHLPLDDAPFGLPEYDGWATAVGLEPVQRYSTWDGDPYDGGGYAVTVHSVR